MFKFLCKKGTVEEPAEIVVEVEDAEDIRKKYADKVAAKVERALFEQDVREFIFRTYYGDEVYEQTKAAEKEISKVGTTMEEVQKMYPKAISIYPHLHSREKTFSLDGLYNPKAIDFLLKVFNSQGEISAE